ncbi:MAG: hypothetical protein ABIQ40_11775 [Bacteroidia bacterium]
MRTVPKTGYFNERGRCDGGRENKDNGEWKGQLKLKKVAEGLANNKNRDKVEVSNREQIFFPTNPTSPAPFFPPLVPSFPSPSFLLVVFLFLHFLGFSVGFEIGAVTTFIFSMDNKATFEVSACNGSDQEKRDKSFKAAHEE